MTNPTPPSPNPSPPPPQATAPQVPASTTLPQVPDPKRSQDASTTPKFEPRRRTPDPRKPNGPFVKYVGIASHRIIRPHHWRAKFGGDDDKMKSPGSTHTWSHKNGKVIPTSEFSDEQLDYLLTEDLQGKGGHSFLEVDYNDKGKLVQVHQLNK